MCCEYGTKDRGKKGKGVERIAQDTRGLNNLHTRPEFWNGEKRNEKNRRNNDVMHTFDFCNMGIHASKIGA